MYLKITDGKPVAYSIEQLRRDNPSTSFPKDPNNELLAEWGVYPYRLQDRPSIDHMTQMMIAKELDQVDGEWMQGWVISNRPIEEAEASVRAKRTALLKETDWLALNDVAMNWEWATYRQGLRDITKQSGFPFSIIWPVKP